MCLLNIITISAFNILIRFIRFTGRRTARKRIKRNFITYIYLSNKTTWILLVFLNDSRWLVEIRSNPKARS